MGVGCITVLRVAVVGVMGLLAASCQNSDLQARLDSQATTIAQLQNSLTPMPTVAPAKPTSPATRNARILFERSGSLILWNSTDNTEKELIPKIGFQFFGDPAWEPNGARIAFRVIDGNTHQQSIYVANSDGTSPQPLLQLTDGNISSLVWTPSGILFNEQIRQNRGWFRLVPETRVVSQETGRLGQWFDVTPDGRKIAYAEAGGLYVSNPSTPNRKIFQASSLLTSPSWAPDGKRIAFSSDRDGGRLLYVINEDGTGLQRITDRPLGDSLRADTQPNWSPDGRTLAFTSNRTGHEEIYLVSVEDGTIRQLTRSQFQSLNPHWDPVLK